MEKKIFFLAEEKEKEENIWRRKIFDRRRKGKRIYRRRKMSRWTDTRNCEEIELEFWTQNSQFGVHPQLSTITIITITIITITIAFYNHHPPFTTIIITLYWRWCTRRQRRRRVGCKYQRDFFFYIFHIIVKRGRGVGSKYQPDFGCLMWMWMGQSWM